MSKKQPMYITRDYVDSFVSALVEQYVDQQLTTILGPNYLTKFADLYIGIQTEVDVVTLNTSDIQALKTDVQNLDNSVDNNVSGINTLQTTINTLQTSLNAIQSSINLMQSQLIGIKTNVNTVMGGLTSAGILQNNGLGYVVSPDANNLVTQVQTNTTTISSLVHPYGF